MAVFKREDWGLLAGAILAVALIGGFLVVTGDPADEEADAGPATTVPARSGLVGATSDADPDLEWATARGAFRVECQDGRVAWLDARVSRLPPDLRYGWRVIADESEDGTLPLTSRPGVTADLTQGTGLPSAFRPTPGGKSTVRFTFANARRDLVVQLGLNVLDVPPRDALVIQVPRLTCRGG